MPTLEIPGNSTIYYELIDGDPRRPWLVFLHEGLGCTRMWKDFPRRLCRVTGCPGLLYDRTGYGRSSVENGERDLLYLHDYALKELPEVVSRLLPGRQHIMVGHSDGATIALIYGAENGQNPLLRGIVSEAAHVFVEPETVRGVEQAEMAFAQHGPGGLEKYHPGRSRGVIQAWSKTWLSDWFRNWNIEELLPGITCPVLALQGADDVYGTVKQVDSIVSRVSGEAQRSILPACGHSPHLEESEQVLDLIAEFVNTSCLTTVVD